MKFHMTERLPCRVIWQVGTKVPTWAQLRCTNRLILLEWLVPLSRASSNHLDDPDALFRTLDEWNEILRGRLADSARDVHRALPQSKKLRSAPPIRRRHKKMGGAA
jgi:hypothetical protein